MKKYFLLILSVIAFGSAFSQTGNDTTKYVYFKYEYGQKFNRIWGLNVVDIPTDTTYSKYGIARKGLNIFVGNGTVWANVTGSGSPGVTSFNTRTGAVTSLSSDYSAYFPLLSGAYNDPSWINTLSASKISSAGSVSAGSSKITLGGTPVGASLQNFSIDVNQANLNLASIGGALGIAQISATGSPSSSTFLRGDGTWNTATGGGIAAPTNTGASGLRIYYAPGNNIKSIVPGAYLLGDSTTNAGSITLFSDTGAGKLGTKTDIANAVALTSTYIGVGNGSNKLSGSSSLYFQSGWGSGGLGTFIGMGITGAGISYAPVEGSYGFSYNGHILGTYNTVIGHQSQVGGLGTQNYNTAVGAYSMGGSITNSASFNIAIGYRSQFYASDSNNISLGNSTFDSTGPNKNSIAIGNHSGQLHGSVGLLNTYIVGDSIRTDSSNTVFLGRNNQRIILGNGGMNTAAMNLLKMVGAIVYNTDSAAYCFYNGTKWLRWYDASLVSGSGGGTFTPANGGSAYRIYTPSVFRSIRPKGYLIADTATSGELGLLPDTSANALATKTDLNNNVAYIVNDLSLGTVNPDSIYGGGRYIRDTHHSGTASAFKTFFDSTVVINSQPGTAATDLPAFRALNSTAATSGGTVQRGGSFYSEGNLWSGSASQTYRFRHYTNPNAGSLGSGAYVFESSWNGNTFQNAGQIESYPSGSPGGTAHFGGGIFGNLNLGYQELTTTTTITGGYYFNCTSGTFTVTLPDVTTTASGGVGTWEYQIINSGSGTITVGTTSSQNITNGATTATTLTLTQGQYVKVKANTGNTKWFVVNTNIGSGSSSGVNIQEFTSSGTWTVPAGAKRIRIKVWGAGGGGGSGRQGAAGTIRVGGGGGGAGGYAEFELDATSLLADKSSWTVTVGTGGAGAAAQTTASSDGSTGTAGGLSAFDSLVYAAGGNAGVGGAGGFGGAGGGGGGGPTQGGIGGANASTAGNGGNDVPDQTTFTSLGGGSGGGLTAGDVVGGYGHGGTIAFYTVPRDAWTAGYFTSEGNNGKQIPGFLFGSGGNGSSASKTANCLAGGNGALYGGGAGGGGASVNGFNSGAGGAGANGHVTVITSF